MVVRKITISVLLCLVAVSLVYAGPQTTSSTTGSSLITRIRVYLDESSAVKWSDATLLQFVNDGIADISSRTHAYQDSESISLVADTIEYTPTGNYISIIAIICNPATGSSWGLKRGNIRSVGLESFTGDTPEFWYEFAGKIGVYPAYSSVTTETVTVYYSKLPSTISSSGNIPISAVFDKALVYYAAAQAFMLDKRIAEASNYMTLYLSEIDRYRQDFIGADEETTEPIR